MENNEIIAILSRIEEKIDKQNLTQTEKGTSRKVDNLGRITLPINIRRDFDIDEGTQLKIYTIGDKIILEK